MNQAATGTNKVNIIRSPESQQIRRVRAILNLPPLIFVTGLVLFWLYFILFGNSILHIRVLADDPNKMSLALQLLGYLFLLGTILNVLVYPVFWLLLYIFKEPLASSARYFCVIWIFSGSAICLFWPQIHWFMD